MLIQAARKEDGNENPQNRPEHNAVKTEKSNEGSLKEADAIEYVVERLLKLKPVKKQSLINSIKAMFQFQGGISDSDTDKIISELQKHKHIKVEQNKVFYL